MTVTLRSSERKAREEQNLRLPEGLRVLVVDDDEISCEHSQLVLRSLGAEAETETDPRRALARLREAREAGQGYALLLTDYRMPEMNGLELIRALRGFDGGGTAAVMLTGYNWDIIEEEAIAEGTDAILAKPLFADTLLRQLWPVLERNGLLRVESGELRVESAPAGAESSLGGGEETADIAGRRVLMAEDVDQNAEILADLLELEDVLSERAANGQEAVDMFAASPEGWYDIILMDVRMPVLDGLAATRAIRALDRPDAKTIPIVAMTANVFDEDVQNSLQAGMNAHLGKPVEPEKLYETIGKMVAGKETRDKPQS